MFMTDFFFGKKRYGGRWAVKSVRNFTEAEQNEIAKATVVSSEYGNSCCFFMKNGDLIFQPMSNDSTLTVGQDVDITKAEIVTLCKEGENDIERIRL